MSTPDKTQEAINTLDMIGTQASAIATLGDLLYAIDPESEHLRPETLNNIGYLLEVVSKAMLKSAFLARQQLGAAGY